MIYPNTFEQKISFDVVRKDLKELCLCPLGEQRVDEMAFSSNYTEIKHKIRQTTEFMRILQNEDFPDQNFFDVRPYLKRIRIENTFLEEKELFELQRSLDTICKIVTFLKKSVDEDGEIPCYVQLNALTNNVVTYPQLVKRIDQILDKYGKVKDTASPTLLMIRRELASTAGSISRTLANIMKSAKGDGLIDKDIAPTLRDGRLVIPVAPAMKRKIRGIVHDESDSGRTVYIEPAEVVEANNKIRELESAERQEIKRILMEFTATVRPDVQEIMYSYEFLADIDFIRAKAKFAIATNSIEPSIEEKQMMDWCMAVHPLLQRSLQKHGRKVVPLDILLNHKQRILLISGPNAGGKSVCLKTVGLLQYMIQCGLPVPMAESSKVGIFRNLFIDIGDEQSLENDLSTYSSHLLNMKNMMKSADGASLILIDEFGTGTEPQIGGAIAQAVLQRFVKRHAFGVINTHYQNLKHYAQETDGMVNGAMLYDRQQMAPLFQLQIGNPGSSFAVEIARKIGIPDDIIAEASELVGQEYINSDKYLQDIVRDKRYWENKRQNIHQHEKQMEQTIERYEAEIKKLHDERKDIIAKAKADAEELLKNSNARIEQTIREIKEAQAEKERTRNIRQDFNQYKQEVAAINPEEMEEKIRRQMEKIKARKQRKENGEKKKDNNISKNPLNTQQIQANATKANTESILFKEKDWVRIKGTNTPGQIMKISGNEASVAFGAIRSNVKINRLEPCAEPQKKKESISATFVSSQTRDEIREKTLNFSQDIDVRGMRGDEAIQAVTYFIDDALVAGASRVRILHGTGSGILRTLIRQYVATIPAVSDYRDEHPQFGGAGITIVEFM
ncbi:MAG: Smr/MutS family protein [Bacteroidaceae bacterium]|nr:Smr/MutS family protein [Bacteroidaceae bacterium]